MLQIHLYFVAKGRVTEEALATNIKIGGGGKVTQAAAVTVN